jgi:hypothetical protein
LPYRLHVTMCNICENAIVAVLHTETFASNGSAKPSGCEKQCR